MGKQPPKYALHFLRWFCREDYLEEIEGNLIELYEQQYDVSPAKAKRQFFWNVLRHFRPAFIRSFKMDYNLTQPDMLHHYFLLAFRNFKRFKTTFFINLIGLSSGIGCALLIYLWVHDELNVDRFFKKDEQIFHVMENQHNTESIVTTQETPTPLAEALAQEIPEVVYAASATDPAWRGEFTLSVEDTHFRTKAKFASNDFFKIFSYDFLEGNSSQILADKSAIVITESLARKLFGTTEGIVGKSLEWEFSQYTEQVSITGVLKDIPANASDQFEFVLPFEKYKELKGSATNWGNFDALTYVVLRKGTDVDQFNEKIKDFIKGKNEDSNVTLFAIPYAERYLYGTYENGVQAGGRIEYVRLFSIIAIFILLIACINFMNLSTAKASRRFKEVGIKKAMGAHRASLILQYLSESIIITFISLLTSILLVGLLLPKFNEITGKQLSLSFDLDLIIACVVFVLLTGLLAGSYPALYLSGFNPVVVLKGKVKGALGELWVRNGLVIFQFSLSVILIVSVLVVHQQIEFVQHKNLGYDKDNIIYFSKDGKLRERLESFLAEARTIPGAVNVSAMRDNIIGSGSYTTGLDWEGKNSDDIIRFENVTVGYDLIETLGIEVVAGRTFSRDFSADSTKIIFNETAIRAMGLQDPVGKMVNLWGQDREIIGVVKDFNFESLHEEVKPLFFKLDTRSLNNVMVKVEAGKEKETISQLQKLYKKFNSDYVFDYHFLDQTYQAQYVAEQRVAILSQYFTGLAIIISCLGLFGLAAFTAERRLKEIGIRKVLGSSELDIVYLLSSDFTKMVLAAILIALPISYVIATKWLEGFAFRIDLAWWYFAGAGLAALLIAWFTVGVQTVKVARVNPVQCLKDE